MVFTAVVVRVLYQSYVVVVSVSVSVVVNQLSFVVEVVDVRVNIQSVDVEVEVSFVVLVVVVEVVVLTEQQVKASAPAAHSLGGSPHRGGGAGGEGKGGGTFGTLLKASQPRPQEPLPPRLLWCPPGLRAGATHTPGVADPAHAVGPAEGLIVALSTLTWCADPFACSALRSCIRTKTTYGCCGRLIGLTARVRPGGPLGVDS